ncbi:glutathione transferase GstA [Azospirillum doebereinerae]
MKLYYKPGACSLSPHIVLREAGLPFDLVKVDLAKKTLEDGSDFLAVNPKGQVPTLGLDDGGILTEAAVTVQYIADQAPASGLIPAAGTIARYRVLEWLNFVSSELHKSFSPLFRPNTPDAYKEIAKQTLAAKFGAMDRHLEGKPYLTGETFTVADAYAFVVLGWAPRIGIPLTPWPNLEAFAARVGARPAVKDALAAEAQG